MVTSSSLGFTKKAEKSSLVLDQTFEEEKETVKYKIGKTIAHGSFGIVSEGINLKTGCKVAIKRVFIDHRYKNRELDIL